jgi:hypothetical protein
MKRVIALALAAIFLASVSIAQDSRLLNEFSRTSYFGGAKLSFVLLNDKTIDMLFKGASRDTIKSKIESGMAFYITGIVEKDTKMNTNFIMSQGEEKFVGSVMNNIKNLADGVITKGEKVSGILKFEKKVNLTKIFTLKNTEGYVDFKITDAALRNVAP